MTEQKTLERNREQILRERAQVLAEREQLREFLLSEVDIDMDEGDAEVSEREKNAALINVLERRLREIDAALLSMENGQYGICERCGQPIDPGRLEVKPDATFCLNCQQQIEKRNRPRRARSSEPW